MKYLRHTAASALIPDRVPTQRPGYSGGGWRGWSEAAHRRKMVPQSSLLLTLITLVFRLLTFTWHLYPAIWAELNVFIDCCRTCILNWRLNSQFCTLQRNAWSWAGLQIDMPRGLHWAGMRNAPRKARISWGEYMCSSPGWSFLSARWPPPGELQSHISSSGSPWHSYHRKDSRSQSCAPGWSARWRKFHLLHLRHQCQPEV